MPRFSVPIHDSTGRVIGIACGRRRKVACATCKQADAKLECDGCDKPLCASCAVSPKHGVDLCPLCFEPAWKRFLSRNGHASTLSRQERRMQFRAWARANTAEFLRLVQLSASGKMAAELGPPKTPRELWGVAGGRIENGVVVAQADPEKYRALMQAHGHIVSRRK